jgi:DNA-binding NarL/FixJ family response regulator
MSRSTAWGKSRWRDRDCIRVLVADHEIAREDLGAIREIEPGLETVGVAGPARYLAGLVEQVQPDMAVLDPRLPAMGRHGVCARLVERHLCLGAFMVSNCPRFGRFV